MVLPLTPEKLEIPWLKNCIFISILGRTLLSGVDTLYILRSRGYHAHFVDQETGLEKVKLLQGHRANKRCSL